jgi:hypothetical protein
VAIWAAAAVAGLAVDTVVVTTAAGVAVTVVAAAVAGFASTVVGSLAAAVVAWVGAILVLCLVGIPVVQTMAGVVVAFCFVAVELVSDLQKLHFLSTLHDRPDCTRARNRPAVVSSLPTSGHPYTACARLCGHSPSLNTCTAMLLCCSFDTGHDSLQELLAALTVPPAGQILQAGQDQISYHRCATLHIDMAL